MEKSEPSCTAGGNADWCSTVENSMELLQKLKNGAALWPSVSISENISEEFETLIHKNICTPMSITVLFTIAKIWKWPKCPSVEVDLLYCSNYCNNSSSYNVSFGHFQCRILELVIWNSIFLTETYLYKFYGLYFLENSEKNGITHLVTLVVPAPPINCIFSCLCISSSSFHFYFTFLSFIHSNTHFSFFNIFYWLCYYSCPIFFSPVFPYALHHPSTSIPPHLVHVHGPYI